MASATSFALRSARSKLPQMLGSDLLSQLPETFVRSLVSPVGPPVALAADKAAQGGWRLDVPSELRADPPVSFDLPNTGRTLPGLHVRAHALVGRAGAVDRRLQNQVRPAHCG